MILSMWKIRTDNSEENNIINGIRTKKFKPIFLSSRDKLKLKNEHIKRKVLKNPWTILEMTKIPPTSTVSPVWDYFVGRNSKNGMITWDYIVDVDHWVIIHFKYFDKPEFKAQSQSLSLETKVHPLWLMKTVKGSSQKIG